MCQTSKGCEHPEKLKGEMKDCSPEKIAECHPEVKGGEHPCEEKKKE